VYELHAHTYCSHDSLLRPERLLATCRKKGIDRVAVTDHNSIRGALEAEALDPAAVIVGEEIMTLEGEILAYFVREEIPAGLTPEATIDRLRNQGAFISVSHPFDITRPGSWQEDRLRRILPLVDALEVFNARTWSPAPNRRALELACEVGLPGTAGSDAHAPAELGAAVMVMPEFSDAAGMRQAVRTADIRARASSPLVHLLSRYASIRKSLGWKAPSR
jgi:predicted metal-dependent phosphoesterase TrpH